MSDKPAQKIGTVASVAGRCVTLFDGVLKDAKLAARALQVIAGDRVVYNENGAENLITEVRPRTNCLSRTFSYQDREIAANLDRLFVITAVDQLFNTVAIDRVLAVAHSQEISCTLVVNKIDLGREARADIYRKIGYQVLESSAKFGRIDELLPEFAAPELQVVALCGVSGVGKSTILNKLVPGTERKTSTVSEKTGQGKQTTSQGVGYPYERPGISPLLVIDLPGVQHFGVSNLSKLEIAQSFPEFLNLLSGCEYSSCLHLAEPSCAVKTALASGVVANSRYESYLSMIREIDEMPDSRKYR